MSQNCGCKKRLNTDGEAGYTPIYCKEHQKKMDDFDAELKRLKEERDRVENERNQCFGSIF